MYRADIYPTLIDEAASSPWPPMEIRVFRPHQRNGLKGLATSQSLFCKRVS